VPPLGFLDQLGFQDFAGSVVVHMAGAAAALAAASRARAALDGRDYVVPDDVKYLALPALRHRVILSPAAEIEGRTTDETLVDIIEQTAAPR